MCTYLCRQVCSPRPRGCSLHPDRRAAQRGLLPAPAGMFPPRPVLEVVRIPAPRARGDVPIALTMACCCALCSPRPRGCSRDAVRGHADAHLLPAPAGMFPPCARWPTAQGLLPAPAGMFPSTTGCGCGSWPAPRARGDVPRTNIATFLRTPCSPRPRGCSHQRPWRVLVTVLLPAPAGMFPTHITRSDLRISAPRARGDVPWASARRVICASCSPRPRGCSLALGVLELGPQLLPAPAGMFPR